MIRLDDSPLDVARFPDPYEVASISPVAAPTGLSGTDWHRYEICQGSNRIVGYREGATQAVREAVEAIVEHLNFRRRGQRGRSQLVLRSGGAQK